MKGKGKCGRAGRRRVLIIGCLAVCLGGLWIWTNACEASAYQMPGVSKVSIEEILEKKEWDMQDYRILEEQTGLAEEALNFLREKGRQKELVRFQKKYFTPVKVACVPNSIISKTEYAVNDRGAPEKVTRIPYIEEGDILITCCSHVFGWRNGHAALVVDADKRLVLEAQVLGSPSVITSLDVWEEYPSFVVLRLSGAARETRAEIAEYAREHLTGVPYRVTAGIMERFLPTQGTDTPPGTHCAHLVWYAYCRFGYDLDSDGGIIVTPKDIAGSPKLTVIQKFGVG